MDEYATAFTLTIHACPTRRDYSRGSLLLSVSVLLCSALFFEGSSTRCFTEDFGFKLFEYRAREYFRGYLNEGTQTCVSVFGLVPPI